MNLTFVHVHKLAGLRSFLYRYTIQFELKDLAGLPSEIVLLYTYINQFYLKGDAFMHVHTWKY